MSDPVPFPLAVKLPQAPQPGVVRLCESLLEQAKSGELTGLAVAVVYRDDLSPSGSINSSWANGQGTYHAMSAALGKLQRAWGRYCDDLVVPEIDDVKPEA